MKDRIPSPATGTTRQSPVVIDLNDKRLQRHFELGIIKAYEPGQVIEIKPSSTYTVRTGCVQLVKNVTTVGANRNSLICDYGPTRLINGAGLIGKGELLPGTLYIAKETTHIVEFSREQITNRPQLMQLLMAFVATLAQQATDDQRAICGLVTEKTKQQTEREVALESRLQETETAADAAESASADAMGKLTITESNLRNTTAELNRARRVIDDLRAEIKHMQSAYNIRVANASSGIITDLRKQIARLQEELTEARSSAADTREQMHDAVEAFESNRQQTANLWQCFEEFMRDLGVARLPPKMRDLLLGFESDELEATLEASLGGLEVIVDLDDLIVAEEPGFSDTDEHPIPDFGTEPRVNRTTLMGIIPTGETKRIIAEAQVRQALEAPSLFDAEEDADVDSQTLARREAARQTSRVPTRALGISPADVRKAADRIAAQTADSDDEDEELMRAKRARDGKPLVAQTEAFERPTLREPPKKR